MSFRILNQAPQYLLASGQVNAGGSLTFYETDLTTLKNTWSDPDLSTPNANPVTLDAAGRSTTDIWGDGEYGVVCKDSGGAVVWTRNNVRPDVGAGTVLPDPALGPGQFVMSAGSQYILQDVRQVPDPTGLNNYVLISDGEQPVFVQQEELPDLPEDGIENITNGVRIGNLMILSGTETLPVTGTHTSSKAVTFSTAFSATPRVFATTQTPGITPLGATGCVATPSPTTTGFTVNVDVNIDSVDSGWNITVAPVVNWLAIGDVAS